MVVAKVEGIGGREGWFKWHKGEGVKKKKKLLYSRYQSQPLS